MAAITFRVMRFYVCHLTPILFIFAVITASESVKASDSLEPETLAQLQFDTASITAENILPSRAFGLVSGTLADYGFRFELPVHPRLISWAQLLYSNTQNMTSESVLTAHRFTTLEAKNDLRSGAGVDRLWMLNKRHSWAFVTGLGLFLMRRELVLRSTPQLCYGSDACSSTRSFTHDLAAYASMRLGFRAQQVKLGLFRPDIGFGIQSSLARWPGKIELNRGDGTTQNVAKIPGKIYLEAVTHF